MAPVGPLRVGTEEVLWTMTPFRSSAVPELASAKLLRRPTSVSPLAPSFWFTCPFTSARLLLSIGSHSELSDQDLVDQ